MPWKALKTKDFLAFLKIKYHSLKNMYFFFGTQRSQVQILSHRVSKSDYLNYAGEIEADKGEAPCFGKGMEAAVNSYQRNALGYKKLDGEITAGKKMWKSLLGMV